MLFAYISSEDNSCPSSFVLLSASSLNTSRIMSSSVISFGSFFSEKASSSEIDLIEFSKPFGAQGTFYVIWVNKDGAYDDFTRFSIDSEKVMREREISDTWKEYQREKSLLYLENAKKRFSKKQYVQEYMGEFIEDLHRWFTDEYGDRAYMWDYLS